MKLLIIWMMTLTLTLSAHEGGHGPKVADAPEQGGVVAPVVRAQDANLGAKAPLKHKAEIIRAQDGTVRVYFYDPKMNPLNPGVLAATASGTLISGKKGKVSEQKFELLWKDDHFEGKSPKPTRKPFDLEVKVFEGSSELHVVFDNMD